jgi:hypothetical protein
MSRCLLLSAFQTGKPCGFKVYSSALPLLLVLISPVECFGYDHRRSACSSLIRFSVQIALYVFPLLWAALLIVSLLKLGFASVQSIFIIKYALTNLSSFIPIVLLALVFNMTNVIGFTYA